MPKIDYLDLDGAWDESGIPILTARPASDVPLPETTEASFLAGMTKFASHDWGPRLRYIATRRDIDAFYREVEGRSGGFHPLWIR